MTFRKCKEPCITLGVTKSLLPYVRAYFESLHVIKWKSQDRNRDNSKGFSFFLYFLIITLLAIPAWFLPYAGEWESLTIWTLSSSAEAQSKLTPTIWVDRTEAAYKFRHFVCTWTIILEHGYFNPFIVWQKLKIYGNI